jgi:magnesium chelatase accessory protein
MKRSMKRWLGCADVAQGLVWERDGQAWPHREHSRFVEAAGLRWHVQQWPLPLPVSLPKPKPKVESKNTSSHSGTGQAPTLVLLHGTGASTHSWRGLAPFLAQHFKLVSLDLPGHGFSGPAPPGFGAGNGASLPGMARGVAALLAAENIHPQWLVGHSAGAAIAVQMSLQGLPLEGLIGLNAALLPLPGLAGSFFSPAAKLLALNPLVPHFFSWRAHSRSVLQGLLNGTGSRLDEAGVALYRQLVTNPGHVGGALAMMARWDLPSLASALPHLKVPLHLVMGEEDGTVPPADARRVQALVPCCSLVSLPGLGHLAHEEDPATVAALILRITQAPAAEARG